MALTSETNWRRPPPDHEIEAMARAGDFEEIWRLLYDHHWGQFRDVEAVVQALFRAVEVRATRDTAEFSSSAFARMIAFTSGLLLRAHLYVAIRVRAHGRSASSRGHSDLPRDVVDDLLPRVIEIQQALAHLLNAQAATERLIELTRTKRLENDKVEATGVPEARGKGRRGAGAGGCTGPARSANGNPTRPGRNGDAGGRLHGLFDDAGPLDGTGGHDEDT